MVRLNATYMKATKPNWNVPAETATITLTFARAAESRQSVSWEERIMTLYGCMNAYISVQYAAYSWSGTGLC